MERSVWGPKSLLRHTLNKNIFRNPTQLISRNSIRRVSAITRLKTDAPSTVTTRLAWNSKSPNPRLLPFQFKMQRTLSRNIFCSHNTERVGEFHQCTKIGWPWWCKNVSGSHYFPWWHNVMRANEFCTPHPREIRTICSSCSLLTGQGKSMSSGEGSVILNSRLSGS